MSASLQSSSSLTLPSNEAASVSTIHEMSDSLRVENPSVEPQKTRRFRRWARAAVRHVRKHAGLGIVCAVAYFDPGNWSVDLEAGSEFGYKLLFVVLLAGLMAVVFQAMASRLGCVTGLATHCRLLLYNRPNHPRLHRWLLLYPLYILSEVAIISTDLAELLGTATALTLLIPSLPLWAGVLLTASDVFVVLAFCSPGKGKSRVFELLIGALVLAVFVSLVFVIAEVNPNWGEAFYGFVPSATVIQPGALYTSIGIIGATVMPHGLFLGSSLATQDRVSSHLSTEKQLPNADSVDSLPSSSLKNTGYSLRPIFKSWRVSDTNESNLPSDEKGHAGWNNNPLSFVRAHLRHGIVDIVLSLLGFAVVINSLILIISSAVFFHGTNDAGSDGSVADLFEAYDLIKQRVGKAAAVVFALALLFAGESAGITATLAGQIVSEGFLRWHVSPVIRRALTRLIGLVPAMLVAAIMGRSGLNTLLVASQVVLSFVLPFVALPLVWITSNPKLMSVRRDTGEPKEGTERTQTRDPEKQEDGGETVDFSNGKAVMLLGYLIWLVVLVANAYVLVTLAMGNSGCEFFSFQMLRMHVDLFE